MASSNKTIALIFAIVLLSSISAFAQSDECSAVFTFPSIDYIDRDGRQTISQPLGFTNSSCPVGGINIKISTDPFGALEPVGIDTVGCRIAGFEYLDVIVNRLHHYMQVVAIANWPNAQQTPAMDTGTGTLFNILFKFGCGYQENVSVDINFDSIVVADSSGNILFDDITFNNSTIYVGNEVNPVVRGDTNCDGRRIGSDVTYLVSYFRGLTRCPCSRCAGDTNGDGLLIGSDVTYMVQYLGGRNPEPGPCDE
jgi:hypothetical protein